MTEEISIQDYKNKVEEEMSKLDKEMSRLEEEKDKIEERERYLKRLEIDVPQGYIFELETGGTLRNLQDLKKALDKMSDKEFKKHVTNEKNDFANWVRDLIDMDLGNQMNQFKRKKSLQDFLSKLDKANIDELIKQIKEEEDYLEKAEKELNNDENQLRTDEDQF